MKSLFVQVPPDKVATSKPANNYVSVRKQKIAGSEWWKDGRPPVIKKWMVVSELPILSDKPSISFFFSLFRGVDVLSVPSRARGVVPQKSISAFTCTVGVGTNQVSTEWMWLWLLRKWREEECTGNIQVLYHFLQCKARSEHAVQHLGHTADNFWNITEYS